MDEPNMLQSLNARYMKNRIYTRTGPILVALNPWRVSPKAILTAGLLCQWLWYTTSPSLFLNGRTCMEPPSAATVVSIIGVVFAHA